MEQDQDECRQREAEKKMKSREKRMKQNQDECRQRGAEKEIKSRKKRVKQNPQECREQEASKKIISRQKGKSDEKKASIRFQNATRHGPIFVCSCCYTRQFQENTLKLNKVKN